MQHVRTMNPIALLLLLGVLTASPAMAETDEPAEAVEATEADASDEATEPETSGPESPPEIDEEEQAQLREDIEQREAEREKLRQQNCEKARAELEQLEDLPANRMLRTEEDGTVTRLTEEEAKKHLEKLRKAEAEYCQ